MIRLLLCALLLTITTIQAAPLLENAFRDRWSLGVEASNWTYREYSDGNKFMLQHGNLFGVNFSYRRLSESQGWYLKPYFNYETGKTKYKGGLQDGTPYNEMQKNTISWYGFEVGSPIGVHENYFFTPHLGVGMRTLDNPKSSKYSYDRNISYLYFPAGFTIFTKLSEHFYLETDATYNYFMGGTASTKLGDQADDVYDFEQTKGIGFTLSMSLKYVAENYSLFLTPFYEYWKIEDSDPITVTGYIDGDYVEVTMLEPENTTHNMGLRLGVSF